MYPYTVLSYTYWLKSSTQHFLMDSPYIAIKFYISFLCYFVSFLRALMEKNKFPVQFSRWDKIFISTRSLPADIKTRKIQVHAWNSWLHLFPHFSRIADSIWAHLIEQTSFKNKEIVDFQNEAIRIDDLVQKYFSFFLS